jgi:hypothetical protein
MLTESDVLKPSTELISVDCVIANVAVVDPMTEPVDVDCVLAIVAVVDPMTEPVNVDCEVDHGSVKLEDSAVADTVVEFVEGGCERVADKVDSVELTAADCEIVVG